MPFFVVLGNWTNEGIRKVQEAPVRVRATHNMVEKVGGKMQLFYTLGRYDFVMVFEVPSDEALMKVLLGLSRLGNVRTETLKAWSEAEGAKVISEVHP